MGALHLHSKPEAALHLGMTERGSLWAQEWHSRGQAHRGLDVKHRAHGHSARGSMPSMTRMGTSLQMSARTDETPQLQADPTAWTWDRA